MPDKWFVTFVAAAAILCCALVVVGGTALERGFQNLGSQRTFSSANELGPMHTFNWSRKGVETLVSSLGQPWNLGWISTRTNPVSGIGGVRSWYWRPGSAMMLETERSGQVTYLFLQSGTENRCGQAANLTKATSQLVRGLGLGLLRKEETAELMGAWNDNSIATVSVPDAIIMARSSDSCIFQLSFDAEQETDRHVTGLLPSERLAQLTHQSGIRPNF